MTPTQWAIIAGLGALWLLNGASWHRPKNRRRRSASRRPSVDSGLIGQLEAGTIGGTALRDLMASGQLRVKRNPEALTEADRTALAKAEKMANEFHGAEGERQIIELAPSERVLPRYLVALGSIPELDYEPGRGSQRAGYIWQHLSGDRGILRSKAKNKPVLAADPVSRRPVLVPMHSSMKWDPERGLIG